MDQPGRWLLAGDPVDQLEVALEHLAGVVHAIDGAGLAASLSSCTRSDSCLAGWDAAGRRDTACGVAGYGSGGRMCGDRSAITLLREPRHLSEIRCVSRQSGLLKAYHDWRAVVSGHKAQFFSMGLMQAEGLVRKIGIYRGYQEELTARNGL